MASLTVVADACCLLNLLATRREVEIIEALDWQLVTTSMAVAQVSYLRSPPDADGERERLPADLEPLRAARRLVARSVADDWVEDFVACAEQLEDADASCVALAGTLRAPLLTDDCKVRRVAREMYPSIKLLSTLGLLWRAVRAMDLDEAAQIELSHDLRWRGNFLPPIGDPRARWFRRLLARARPGGQAHVQPSGQRKPP